MVYSLLLMVIVPNSFSNSMQTVEWPSVFKNEPSKFVNIFQCFVKMKKLPWFSELKSEIRQTNRWISSRIDLHPQNNSINFDIFENSIWCQWIDTIQRPCLTKRNRWFFLRFFLQLVITWNLLSDDVFPRVFKNF